ncbi:HypC/HybG/HupF family hydrogenase formation chaperone [Thiolapillus sp.]
MCLGIPMRVLSVDGFVARCEAKGVQREVNLFLMQEEEVNIGDYLVMHAGYATQKVTAEEAASAWEIYDQILAAQENVD